MKTICLFALAAIAATSPSAFAAEQQCGPLNQVILMLADRYGEGPVWYGTTPKGLELRTESPGGETWTLLLIGKAKGKMVACLLGSGTDSKAVQPKDDHHG